MSLNLPLKWQVPAIALIFTATCVPTAITLYRQSEAQMSQKSAIDKQSAIQSEDIRIALDRANRCILIDERFPMVEGASAYYDPTNRVSKRLLPANTALCSSTSGYTAIVDASGAVSQIKQAPIEQISRILKQRGLK